MLRLRIGFVLIAVVLSFFGARLVQLQGVDPQAYALRAAAEGAARVTLVAERGDILDRNGVPLADSIKGKMVVADPALTADRAPEIARLLSDRLSVDYFRTLTALRGRQEGSRYEYVARRVPSTLASDTLAEIDAAGFSGISLQDDPIRDYPAGDVAANLLGYMGTDEPLGGFERTFDEQLAGIDGEATWQSTSGKGNRIPLRESTLKAAQNGAPLRTTIDRDLQWFTQKVLAETVQQYRAASGSAIVMDTRTGEILALADVPTFDANEPSEADEEDLGSRAMSDIYEPGSVQKVLTAASLIDADKAFARQQVQGAGQPAAPGPGHRRLVRPRQHPAHPGRHHRQVVQHRHGPGRRRLLPGRAGLLPPALRPRPAHRHRRARRDGRHPDPRARR